MKKVFLFNHTPCLFLKSTFESIIFKLSVSLSLIASLSFSSFAQKTVSALHIDEKITVDANFNEGAWDKQTDVATEFTSVRPIPNQKPKYPTEVKVVYDDNALYISAKMVEGSSDSISSQLMLRDQIGNTDFFGVIIDTYGNGNNAFEFILSCTGVQFDALVTPQNEDNSWDAVWFGAARIAEDGWYAEMKIPYSAIRFPSQDIQKWNVNFFRRRQASGEQYCWNNVDFEQDNAWLNQVGTLTGIENIKPPLRLSLTPYASVYGVHSHDPNGDPQDNIGSSYNMGMDIKYGINDAYTLDMTLIPDFGQVQSDNQVLNLSPFEVRFNENRAFFTEGIEMFDKSGIFYSRRVGNNQQLYNATKVSGRGDKGLGIGVFNAVAAEKSHMELDLDSDREVKKIDMPLTNYNIVVFDQDIKNNGSISLTNTSVLRKGDDFHNANVTAATYNVKNKKQSFGINGKVAYSQLINKQSENVNGMDARVSVEKLSGSVIGGLTYREVSKDYNHNDLGYFRFGNYRELSFYLVRRDLDGFGAFNRFNLWLNGNYERNIVPDAFVGFRGNTGFYLETKSFLGLNGWMNVRTKRNDFYEPRIEGRHFERPSSINGGFWFGTDRRKKLRVNSWMEYTGYGQNSGWSEYGAGPAVNYRFSDKFNLEISTYIWNENNAQGFANIQGDKVIFGKRDVRTVSNNVRASYTFNQNMGLNLITRHYWSKVKYNDYAELNDIGQLAKSDYDGFHDLSFTAFTVDMDFRWRFAPGSEMAVVWKNNISGVFQDQGTDYSEVGYADGISRLKALPQTNSLSVRFSYYLDYYDNIKGLFKKNNS